MKRAVQISSDVAGNLDLSEMELGLTVAMREQFAVVKDSLYLWILQSKRDFPFFRTWLKSIYFIEPTSAQLLFGSHFL